MPTPAATLQAQIDAVDSLISNAATAGYTNLQDGEIALVDGIPMMVWRPWNEKSTAPDPAKPPRSA